MTYAPLQRSKTPSLAGPKPTSHARRASGPARNAEAFAEAERHLRGGFSAHDNSGTTTTEVRETTETAETTETTETTEKTRGLEAARLRRLGSGVYQVVPGDTELSIQEERQGFIAERDFFDLKAIRRAIRNSEIESLTINEFDDKGQVVPGFRQVVLAAIDTLISKPAGRALILEIVQTNTPYVISISALSQEYGSPAIAFDPLGTDGGEMLPERTPGLGASTSVKIIAGDTLGTSHTSKGIRAQDPFFLRLAHELIHGLHSMAGVAQSGVNPNPIWGDDEEFVTITSGIIATGNGAIKFVTENEIAREHGLDPRISHLSPEGGARVAPMNGPFLRFSVPELLGSALRAGSS